LVPSINLSVGIIVACILRQVGIQNCLVESGRYGNEDAVLHVSSGNGQHLLNAVVDLALWGGRMPPGEDDICVKSTAFASVNGPAYDVASAAAFDPGVQKVIVSRVLVEKVNPRWTADPKNNAVAPDPYQLAIDRRFGTFHAPGIRLKPFLPAHQDQKVGFQADPLVGNVKGLNRA
jgi:hypothetical protein